MSTLLDEGNLVLPQAGDSARVGKEEKPILKKKIKSMVSSLSIPGQCFVHFP